MSVLHAVIIGAGFSGLGMAIALQKQQRRYVVLEKGPGVGGTWRENRYPGCACDVPSRLYSFSFAQNPSWSRQYSTQPELLSYLERCARDAGVLPSCHFNQEVVSCTWDDDRSTWTVKTQAGVTHEARHVVLGVGALHTPKFPSIEGRDSFEGPQLHSAQWDPNVDLRGKRVAVVGTGASAIQIVPALAPHVAQLTLFQRTPAWVLPRNDTPISGLAQWLFRLAPWAMQLARALVYWRLEAQGVAFTRFPALLKAAERMARRHLQAQLKDPQLRERLTPHYAAGCKRILLSDDFYPALARPNVQLEDSAVAAVTPTGLLTTSGAEVPCDAIVWCTGFDVTAPLTRIRITGREGRELARDAWREGLSAYRGTTVPGFPNLFVLLGPNTGLGHNSIVYMIEAQIRFVLSHLAELERAGGRSIEVRAAAADAFNRRLQARMPATVWATGCASWYLDERGHNSLLWPGATFAFRRLTAQVDTRDVLIT